MRQPYTTISLSESEAKRYVRLLERAMDLLARGRPDDEQVLVWRDLSELRDLLARGLEEGELPLLRDAWQRPIGTSLEIDL